MSNIPPKVKVHIPANGATKQLALQSTGKGRKLVVSSNWLPLFGFEKGIEVVEETLGVNKGMVVRLANKADIKRKRVYERVYNKRRNNPLETMMDIRSQKLLDTAFPTNTKKVHLTFEKGKVTIVPISDRQAARIEKAKNSKDLMSAFVAMTGGVDAYALHQEGFKISAAVEYRPQEKKDKLRDLTEVNAMNVLGNVPMENLINEDIGEIDLRRLAKMTQKSPSTLLHISIQCDEFSPAKAHSLREKSLQDLSSSLDLTYDALRLIEEFQFPAIMLENTFGYMTSEAYSILETKIRKWGYDVHKTIAYSPEHGGHTGRRRFYMFATSFDAPFEWPRAEECSSTPIWDTHIAPYLKTLRDVTGSKSIQDGARVGRLRVIDKKSTISPTIMKSQNRMAKDSVVIKDGDRYLFPDNAMLKRLMGIPENFNVDCVAGTIESEIIGQSIDYNMHTRIIQSVKRHLEKASASLFGNYQPSLSI